MLRIMLLLAALATPTSQNNCKPKSLECESMDPKFTVFKACSIKAVNRKMKVVNVFVQLLQTPVTNVTIRTDLLLRHTSSRSPLYSFNIDACRFLESAHRNPLANIVYRALHFHTHSNMNHTCPYDHDLITQNVPVEETFLLPLILPPSEYKMKSYWYAYNVLRATITLNFEAL